MERPEVLLVIFIQTMTVDAQEVCGVAPGMSTGMSNGLGPAAIGRAKGPRSSPGEAHRRARPSPREGPCRVGQRN